MSDGPLRFAVESGHLYLYASARDVRSAADKIEAGESLTFADAEDVMIDEVIPVTFGGPYSEDEDEGNPQGE